MNKLTMLAAAGTVLALGGIASAQTLAQATTELNVRAGPGSQYPVVGVLAAGQDVAIKGCLANGRWCSIDEGWVFADYLSGDFGGGRVVLSQRPANVEALLRSTVDGRTVEELRLELVTKVGENISVRRFDVVESGSTVGTYLHGTRIGVLVEVEGGDAALARDLAMQIASLSPRYVSGDDVPKDIVDKEREIIVAQTAEEKKPPEILAKLVEGKIRKFVD